MGDAVRRPHYLRGRSPADRDCRARAHLLDPRSAGHRRAP